jgi:hypothetical protein
MFDERKILHENTKVRKDETVGVGFRVFVLSRFRGCLFVLERLAGMLGDDSASGFLSGQEMKRGERKRLLSPGLGVGGRAGVNRKTDLPPDPEAMALPSAAGRFIGY